MRTFVTDLIILRIFFGEAACLLNRELQTLTLTETLERFPRPNYKDQKLTLLYEEFAKGSKVLCFNKS